MANQGKDQRTKLSVDRRGTSFLVPLGIVVVFVALVVGWVSMSGHDDASSLKDVMTRPNSPVGRTAPAGESATATERHRRAGRFSSYQDPVTAKRA